MSDGGGMSRGAVTALLIVGALLLAGVVGIVAVVIMGGRMTDLIESGPSPSDYQVARAEAAALSAADEAAGDAVAYLLLAAHDGAETAAHEARAYAHASVTDDQIAAWIELARSAFGKDVAAVDAEVVRSRMDTDDENRLRVTCELAARVDETVWRARAVMLLGEHTTTSGPTEQWELQTLEAMGQ